MVMAGEEGVIDGRSMHAIALRLGALALVHRERLDERALRLHGRRVRREAHDAPVPRLRHLDNQARANSRRRR